MKIILGIDEVGRGPWAGPLVVGACVLREPIEGLTDSKKLSAKKREALAEQIHATANCGLGWVPAAEVDMLGLIGALEKATRAAVKQIDGSYNAIIIDGTINFLKDTPLAGYVQTVKKADLLVPAVSAASIIAKVARDNYMVDIAKKYPEYGFEKHVGYGTAAHKKAIYAHGLCPEHRRSFKPIRDYLGDSTTGNVVKNTTSIGQRGEAVVAEELAHRGHEILARNWKTKACEIDIVSRKDDVIFFTEVKYRCNSERGDGMEAIGAKKLQQMRFAAEFFASTHGLGDVKLRLMAASVSGEDYHIDKIIELD